MLFFMLRIVFQSRVEMTDEEKLSQVMQNYVVQQVPQCNKNTLYWETIDTMHPVYQDPTHYLYNKEGYQGKIVFYVKWRNPGTQPLNNMWGARHFQRIPSTTPGVADQFKLLGEKLMQSWDIAAQMHGITIQYTEGERKNATLEITMTIRNPADKIEIVAKEPGGYDFSAATVESLGTDRTSGDSNRLLRRLANWRRRRVLRARGENVVVGDGEVVIEEGDEAYEDNFGVVGVGGSSLRLVASDSVRGKSGNSNNNNDGNNNNSPTTSRRLSPGMAAESRKDILQKYLALDELDKYYTEELSKTA
jgi:hypothetical protein